MIHEGSVAAATAVVGYNLLQDLYYEELGFDRQLIAFGLKGSAAAGDTEVKIKVGTSDYGSVFNSGTGFPNIDDVKPVGSILIPRGQPLRLEVVDAPATNPLNWLIVLRP
jgi:hypothetical protein